MATVVEAPSAPDQRHIDLKRLLGIPSAGAGVRPPAT
jgi:hypothetical protein